LLVALRERACVRVYLGMAAVQVRSLARIFDDDELRQQAIFDPKPAFPRFILAVRLDAAPRPT
jgi:hypothetical protein